MQKQAEEGAPPASESAEKVLSSGNSPTDRREVSFFAAAPGEQSPPAADRTMSGNTSLLRVASGTFGERHADSPTDSERMLANTDRDMDLPSIAQPLHRIPSFVAGKSGRTPSAVLRTASMLSSVSSPRPQLLAPASPGTAQGGVATLHHHLLTVPHLCTIPFADLAKLDIMTREYAPMDCVLDAGAVVQHVYILISGAIDVFADAPIVGSKRVGRLTAPNVFGMHNVLLDQKNKFAMRAGSHVTILLLLRDDFFMLLRRSKVFASSVSPKIVDQLNVFQNFQTLCRAIFSVSSGQSLIDADSYQLNLASILKAYSAMWNGIHRGQHSANIDFLALKHAIRRLPQNIVETYCLTLSRTLPPFVRKELEFIKAHQMNRRKRPETPSRLHSRDNIGGSSVENLEQPIGYSPIRFADAANMSFAVNLDGLLGAVTSSRPSPIINIPTSDRRRKAYQIARGHTYVMLREGFTDVLDIVSCLCIYLIEGRKARLRLQTMTGPGALDVLQDGLARWARTRVEDHDSLLREVLRNLAFSPEEQNGFAEIWPHSAIHRLTSLLTCREELVVRLDTSLARRFDTDPYLQWALSLRNRVLTALGLPESATVPTTTVIDIVCCNTHTLKNLLCRFARRHKDVCWQWGKATRKDLEREKGQWHNQDDLLYYYASSMAQTDPGWGEQYRTMLEEDGFVVMDDTELTGLQVDIIDLDRVNGEEVDPTLVPAFAARREQQTKLASQGNIVPRHFILNADFAFGAQADGITRALTLTFGFCIRSVNVISKAGGLRGVKGDIVLPDQLVFSKQVLGDDTPDEFRSAGNKDVTKERVEFLAGPNRTVRTGPVLTIPGLVLQNEKVLKYYHRMWSCDGVEMEGSYYARQVEESIGLGLLRSDVATRFGYHIVDLPLAGLQHSRVMGKPTALEAVPPMYALARAMMERIVLF